MQAAAAKLGVAMIQRDPAVDGRFGPGTRSSTWTELPSQLNAVRRVFPTMVCPVESIRTSTNCTARVAVHPGHDLVDDGLVKRRATRARHERCGERRERDGDA